MKFLLMSNRHQKSKVIQLISPDENDQVAKDTASFNSATLALDDTPIKNEEDSVESLQLLFILSGGSCEFLQIKRLLYILLFLFSVCAW